MTSISSGAMLDLSQRQDLVWLAKLVADVRTAAPKLKPLVIGALARDLWLHYGYGIEIKRATEDVDFAVAADWSSFSEAHGSLVATGLFETLRNSPHRLRHRKFGWIDLIPYGAVERVDGTIAWPPPDNNVMGVLGYTEAAATAVDVCLPGNETVSVATLPMLAVLKIFAWQDRYRHTQGKDAVDLSLILKCYLEAGNLDRLYSHFAHLLNDTFDFEPTGAWLLGWDARAYLLDHSWRFDLMIDALNNVLAPQLDPDGTQVLVLQLNPTAADDALKLLNAFHRGLMGKEAQ